jgi:hypothetical protein
MTGRDWPVKSATRKVVSPGDAGVNVIHLVALPDKWTVGPNVARTAQRVGIHDASSGHLDLARPFRQP